ncbi:OLC1v1031731C1 [Oldenlandia corymbosa var. corymbosa]|uniref:OLC1v1031731C1 n=1 Tax=Oldenlandia corymbosa var. corymbosa TaxID=529605 RepID=A0AAV1CK25_OLDCO|nr:OLC1v1031731C1 [Oldenlandia corymbosa var. corymbosa]
MSLSTNSILNCPAVIKTPQLKNINHLNTAVARNGFIPRKLRRRRRGISLRCQVATQLDNQLLQTRKFELLRITQDTQRGLVTTPEQRSSIEEAIVNVEQFCAGDPIKLDDLNGTWRLQYTSAPDVLVLFESATRLPTFFQVGQIFQKFECGGSGGSGGGGESSGGVVRNVVKWSVPNLLEEQDGATLVVSAKFSVVSSRNIYLQFEEISVRNINISEQLQAIIAPALLPRSFLSLQILQFIKAFKAEFPVTNPGRRRSVGGLYYLSYLDRDMLLGRAVGGGGVFLFTRAQDTVY